MNDLLHESPPDIREYILHNERFYHFYTRLQNTQEGNQKLLAINKIHTFKSKVKYMGLLLSSKDNLPTITPLESHVKAISMLPIPITARGIKLFIGCVIYLAQFLPKISEVIKPINDILKKCNKVNASNKISPLPTYAKGKGKGKKRFPDIQKYWMPIYTTNFEAIKELIVQALVLHLPAGSGHFYLECDSSVKYVGSVLYQIQNGVKHVIA